MVWHREDSTLSIK